MHFSNFQNQDKNHVINLFEKVFKKKITEEFWNWRYGMSPFGKPIESLLWAENKLVGYYMINPLPMKINDHLENILLSMSMMIHPDYQGLGIQVAALAKFTFENAIQKGYNLILAFPNELSYKLHFGVLGWKDFGRITEYKKQINTAPNFINSTNYTVEMLKEFNHETDLIWNKYKNEHQILIQRTSDFLNWRFIKHPKTPYENHPSYEYIPFIIRNGTEPVAYFVIKKFGQEKCHVVDYFGLLDNEVITIILSTAESICIENDIHFLSFWENSEMNQTTLKAISTKNGYLADNSHCFFGCKQLTTNNMLYEQKKNFFVTMADSDVF